MKKSNVCNILKILRLNTVRFCKNVFKNFSFKLTLFFVAFSFFVSLFLLLPSTFSKAPVFSYFIKTMDLPLDYELEGKVIIIDSQGNVLNQEVNICIGGYTIETSTNDTFVLDFTAPSTEYIYVVIEYKNSEGIKMINSERIETDQDIKFKKEFKIYV